MQCKNILRRNKVLVQR